MSETRECPECEGGRMRYHGVGLGGQLDSCPACHGAGRVWEPEALRVREVAQPMATVSKNQQPSVKVPTRSWEASR